MTGAVSTFSAGTPALLKADGAVIVEAFTLAAYLEENAYRQHMTMQIGDPYVQRSGAAGLPEKLWSPGLFKKTWDHDYSKLK